MHTIKTLYLSYDGLTDPLGRSQILPYVCGLQQKECAITIISFEKKDRFVSGKEEVEAICKPAGILWWPILYHKWPPIISTLFDLIVLRKCCVNILDRESFHLVHCRSYLTSLVGMALKKKYGLKFIFDMRGFWADERVEGGIWNRSNPLFNLTYRYFKKKELEFLSKSDHIICLTENARREIRSWKINTPITVIPTCVDLTLFNPESVTEWETQKLRGELNIDPGDFVLLYVGSWGTWYLTEEMLKFFSAFRKKVPAKFLILSPDKLNLKGHEFLDDVIVRAVRREAVPLYMSLASSAIAFIKPSFSKKASSATKIGEYLAMGLMVVTNAGWGDIEQLSSENVHVLTDFSPEKLEVVISKLLRNKTSTGINMETHPLALTNGVRLYRNVYEVLTT